MLEDTVRLPSWEFRSMHIFNAYPCACRHSAYHVGIAPSTCSEAIPGPSTATGIPFSTENSQTRPLASRSLHYS